VPTKIYDAIVVGTGAGGGTAMKLLCEAGLSVLALNSGPRMEPAKHYRLHRQPFDLKFRGLGDPMVLAGRAHQELYTVEESEYNEGPELFEHDVAYSNAPGTDWYWKRCKATGGKANFWGRSSARFGDIDFKAADLDGYGETGRSTCRNRSVVFQGRAVHGSCQHRSKSAEHPDGEYLPQIPFRCIDYIIQKRVKNWRPLLAGSLRAADGGARRHPHATTAGIARVVATPDHSFRRLGSPFPKRSRQRI
jgi:choline dehydrogenase-like flavoprotein